MTTNTTPAFPPSRRDPRQVTNTLRFTLNYNDVGSGTEESWFSSLPAGAFITNVMVAITTTFNAASTNVITVGTNTPSYNNIVSSGDVTASAAATTQVTRGNGLAAVLTSTADVPIFAKYAQTGTSATQGQAIIVVEYEGGWLS